MTSFVMLLGVLAAAAGPVDTSKLPAPATRKDVSYEKDIKPLFDRTCIKCHGADKQKAKLRLDSLASVLKGAEDGKVVKPGDSAGSKLVHNVARLSDRDLWMPPEDKGPPLTAEQVGLIRAWIDQGAK